MPVVVVIDRNSILTALVKTMLKHMHAMVNTGHVQEQRALVQQALHCNGGVIPTPPPSRNDSGASRSMSTGVVIGTSVAATVVFVTLVAILGYFFVLRKHLKSWKVCVTGACDYTL